MDALTDDIIIELAGYLCPKDLVRLASTCKRLGGRRLAAAATGDGGGVEASATKKKKRRKTTAARPQGRQSLMEEAAQKLVDAAASKGEWSDCNLLVKKSSELWFEVYRRLHQLQSGPVFYRLIGNSLKHVKGDLAHVAGKRRRDVGCSFGMAACQEIMTEGQHYVEFTAIQGSSGMRPGILRPVKEWDAKGPLSWGASAVPESYIRFCQSQRSLGAPGFGGEMQHLFPYVPRTLNNDVFGLLLDLDEGTLTLYVNGSKGVIVQRGLSGHYCWALLHRPSWWEKPPSLLGIRLDKP